jgi:hypothetical protein
MGELWQAMVRWCTCAMVIELAVVGRSAVAAVLMRGRAEMAM